MKRKDFIKQSQVKMHDTRLENCGEMTNKTKCVDFSKILSRDQASFQR